MTTRPRDLVQRAARGPVVVDAPMRDLTTIQVGGPVDVLVYPVDRDDLARLIVLLSEWEIPCLVIGNGSNLVVRDGGLRGAALQLGKGFRGLERGLDTIDGPTVEVEAGVPLAQLVRWASTQGIGGLEALSGIPGTVGGALVMNAGAWGFEIGECVLELETMDSAGRACVFAGADLRFHYRALDVPRGHTILGALLQGQAADSIRVQTRVEELHRRRRNSQPIGKPSAGSVFKNPPGGSAGRLIEQCGLKGFRIGGAEVSAVHANFIVNAGAATANHVETLISTISERVYQRHGVELELEVLVVGDWETARLRAQE